jgi:hypothetical protein
MNAVVAHAGRLGHLPRAQGRIARGSCFQRDGHHVIDLIIAQSDVGHLGSGRPAIRARPPPRTARATCPRYAPRCPSGGPPRGSPALQHKEERSWPALTRCLRVRWPWPDSPAALLGRRQHQRRLRPAPAHGATLPAAEYLCNHQSDSPITRNRCYLGEIDAGALLVKSAICARQNLNDVGMLDIWQSK